LPRVVASLSVWSRLARRGVHVYISVMGRARRQCDHGDNDLGVGFRRPILRDLHWLVYVAFIFRSTDVDARSFDGYVCIVDLDAGRMVLGRYDNSTWHRITASANQTVSLTGTYEIQASAVGVHLTCRLLPSGPEVSTDDSTYGSGTVGLYTYRADVCFDYLTVVQSW